MAIASSLSGGQTPSIGTQIGGVTQQQLAQVAASVERQQTLNVTGNGSPNGSNSAHAIPAPGMIPVAQDWEGFAFLLLGLL